MGPRHHNSYKHPRVCSKCGEQLICRLSLHVLPSLSQPPRIPEQGLFLWVWTDAACLIRRLLAASYFLKTIIYQAPKCIPSSKFPQRKTDLHCVLVDRGSNIEQWWLWRQTKLEHLENHSQSTVRDWLHGQGPETENNQFRFGWRKLGEPGSKYLFLWRHKANEGELERCSVNCITDCVFCKAVLKLTKVGNKFQKHIAEGKHEPSKK